MENMSFSIFPNDNFLDLRLYQYGWEQCAPLHSFGPYVRNHYLFHYIISGQGRLESNDQKGATRKYQLGADQGFLISPGQVNTYYAHESDPWKYVWLEFDGLRVAEHLDQAGLDIVQPVYQPQSWARRSGIPCSTSPATRTRPPSTSSGTCAFSWTGWSSPPLPGADSTGGS